MTTGAVFALRVVKIIANTYSFHANTTTKIATAMMPGTTSGSTTRTRIATSPAPSTAAASSSSIGSLATNARMIQVPRLT